MPSEPSKYAGNQFESETRGRFPLMSEILSDTIGRVANAVILKPALIPAQTLLNTAITAWNAGETVLATAEAALPAATKALEDKLASLTRKPDLDSNAPLEAWDATIRSLVAYQGSVYTFLLPNGRETLTAGTIEQRLDALRDFGARLSGQPPSRPTLISLGAIVTTFATAARTLRTTQITAKGALDTARANQEPLRVAAAIELYGMIGLGMQVFKATPEMVDTLFDVNLLRGPAQNVPDAPGDISWDPVTRTLTTTNMPAGATRLEAWREGPGGMPEQLVIGEPGALSVVIPAAITFDVGDLYQLWLQGVNSKGTSAPGPKAGWTAV